MPYCTLDQLKTRYGTGFLTELSNREDVAATEPDAALFERAIADAGALIDGYLGKVYALPLAAVPDLVVDLAQRIAVYNAHGAVVADKFRKEYEDALRVLQQIAQGLVALNVAGATPAASGSGGVQATETSKPLSVTSLKGYI